MAISLKHTKNVAKSDGVDATVVQPSDWNAEHTLTAASGKVLGTATGATTVSELPIEVDSTGQSVKLPSGITSSRPGSPGAGMVRYNTSTNRLEYYTDSAWKNVDNMTVSGTQPATAIAGDFWIDTASGNALKQYVGGAWVAVLAYASTTEVLTGTEAAKVATPDAIAALWESGSNIASASTVTMGEGGYFQITGTTTITALAFTTDKAGRTARLRFAGALTLTHNATTLILPGGANITTAAGDIATFISEGSGNFRCVNYQKADGQPLVSVGSMTLLGTITTTSGSTQSLSGLTLTKYKFLRCVIIGVSTNTPGSATLLRMDGRDIADSTVNSGVEWRGIVDVDLTVGTFSANIAFSFTNSSGVSTPYAGDTSITTASTSVSFSLSGNSFDAGSIAVYGIA